MFKCHECGKEFKTVEERDKHSLDHQIVLIKLKAEDLNRLLLFIFSKDESLLTESLVDTLFKYSRK